MPSFLVSTIAQTAKIIWSGDEINLNPIPEATFNLRASPVNVWNERVFFFFFFLLYFLVRAMLMNHFVVF